MVTFEERLDRADSLRALLCQYRSGRALAAETFSALTERDMDTFELANYPPPLKEALPNITGMARRSIGAVAGHG